MGNHIYYKLQFKLLSPMCIGSAISKDTDKDVLLGSDGKPFIPATTIAGRLSSLCTDEKLKKRLFPEAGEESAVIVYDALLAENWNPREQLASRDNVALNQYRVANDHTKFDMQCIQPGCLFTGYLELTRENVDCDIGLQNLLGILAANQCCFGGKTNRGFGKAELQVWRRSFDMDDVSQKNKWLDFVLLDSQNDPEWNKPIAVSSSASPDLRITMDLKLISGLSVRVYRTDASEDETMPDIIPFKVNNMPAIPGTSWAGTFKHRFRELSDSELEEYAFGYVKTIDEKTVAHASRITFSETIIEGGSDKKYTRNAIDRFSGKVKDTALFTEITHYGGTGQLTITLKHGNPEDYNETLDMKARNVLAACIADLSRGFLAVGGLSSVGRGLFHITGITCSDKDLEKTIREWAEIREEAAHE